MIAIFYGKDDFSAHEALDALESVALPTWAREDAEALAQFLAQREF